MPRPIRSCLALLPFALLAGIAAPGPARAQVRVPLERITRIAPDSTLRRGVTVLSARGVDTARVSSAGLRLERGTFAVLKTAEAPRPVAGPVETGVHYRGDPARPAGPFMALPIRLLTPNATGTGTWVLRPVYQIARRMRWNAGDGSFDGAIFIAVEDSLHPRESRPLPTPVRFQLSADADSLAPDTFAVTRTNFPLKRVNVAARDATDSVRVHLAAEFDAQGTDVWVPVEPTLRIEAPARMQGCGVGSARVIVRIAGSRAHPPSAVTLVPSAGELDADTVAIGGAASGSARLRSAGTGPVTLTASAPGYQDATATIQFVFPVVFLLAALLGGVFGGLASAVQSRVPGARTRWGEAALKGVAAGALGALAWYALGVNLLKLQLGVPRFNELAVFTTSALFGFAGLQLLPAADRTEPAHAPEPAPAEPGKITR